MTINILHLKEKAVELMVQLNITNYPVNLIDSLHRLSYLKLSAYSDYCNRSDLCLKDVIDQLGSDDAAVIKGKNDKYILFYNDLHINQNRIVWSIAHELGHIILNHLNDSDCKITNGLSKRKYTRYEAEANMFAAELLSNLHMLNIFGVTSPDDISDICYLSKQASINRFNSFEKWKIKMNTHNSDCILFNLLDKYCIHCGSKYTNSKLFNHCSICGETLQFKNKGVNNMLYNDGYELDKYGKAIECPTCKNSEEHRCTFCGICGNNLINKCSNFNCGEIADGNARYCVHCGSETTFYTQNYLCDYTEFKSVQQNRIVPISEYNILDDIPF